MIGQARFGVLLLLVAGGIATAPGAEDRNLLNWPESVVFDAARDRYIVSNWGHGDLVAMDGDGNQWPFNSELDQAAGLYIEGDVIYTAASEGAITGVIGFDLETGEIVSTIPIPRLELLNDITGDHAGHLYVTDCDDDKIYKITLSTMTYTTFVRQGLGYPNGIIFDEPNNRLLVLNSLLYNGPLLAVDLADSSLSLVAETMQTGLDGLTVDNDGRTYFSSWTTDCVYRFDPGFAGEPEVISTGHEDPADIGFNLREQILAVPNFHQNRVDFVPIPQQAVKGEAFPADRGALLCSPNPFRTSTTIRLAVEAPGRAPEASIHDHLGRCVRTLSSESGRDVLSWGGDDDQGRAVAAGAYFIRLRSRGREITSRVIRID